MHSLIHAHTQVEAWGAVQHSLGLAYQDRIIGDDSDKHRRAIAHFNSSLLVYDRSRYPMQWAKTHHKLAISLLALERAETTSESIGHLDEQRRLGLLLHAVSPGKAHKMGEKGARGRSSKVDAAIGHMELALQVYADQPNVENLWRVQLDLGSAYMLCARSEGMGGAGAVGVTALDRAIMYYESTLRSHGFTRQTQALHWAGVHEVFVSGFCFSLSARESLGRLQRSLC